MTDKFDENGPMNWKFRVYQANPHDPEPTWFAQSNIIAEFMHDSDALLFRATLEQQFPHLSYKMTRRSRGMNNDIEEVVHHGK